ncbi:MAG TPA: tetratricopeptide repeat protein [Verrucomicrobiae bacterium]|nr:tetratricopeptide repeat protein [Verrucomicrobiae bacterium]
MKAHTCNGSSQSASSGAKFLRSVQSDWALSLLLVLLAVAVRAPALSGQLIWDDQYLALENPFIKSPLFVFEAFRHHLFLDSFSSHYRPIQNISFILDYFLWNTNPYGFHLTNVLLHAASGVLLYRLLKRLIRSLWISPNCAVETAERTISFASFFVALLWAVHPVHSAAIDYISGRADSLAALFACLGWLIFLRAREAVSRKWRVTLFGLAALSALSALCSRETACMWLALFLIFQLAFERNVGRRAKAAVLIACLCILGVYLGLRQLPEDRSGPTPSAGWSKSVRAVLMLRALGDYGRLMIFPSNLHMERTLIEAENYRSPGSWKQSCSSEYLSIGGLLLLSAFGIGCFRSGAGQRMRVVGAGWFLLAYLPTSNIVELNATVAEHWLYLPSIGFLLFLLGCVLELPRSWGRGLVAGAACAVVALGVRSAIRSTDWSTPEVFYERTMAAGGVSARVGVNLAQVYANRGELAKAEALCRSVLARTPDYPFARNNLAHVLFREGKTEEARKLFATATVAAASARKEYPRTWIAALNLAHLRINEHHPAEALAILKKAQQQYPQTWEIISLQSELVRESEGPRPALALVKNFAHDNWWHYGAFLALGRLHAQNDDTAEAEAALRHASWLDVHDAEALNLLVAMSVRQNKLQAACRTQRRAVARQPDQPRQYLILSDILGRMGRAEEAVAAVAQATRLQEIGRAEIAAN